jgi:hypothetical protein
MLFTSLLLTLAATVFGQNATGCTTPSCVFSNPSLRFGTGSENSVNSFGLFQQPWYYSPTAATWYKLTFSNYPLDTAIGTGTGSAHWSGTNIVNLYSLTPSSQTTDYSEFVVDSSDTTKTVGHGKIVARRAFVISGQAVILENTFSLGANQSFVKIITTLINNSSQPIVNAIIWTGTRDDYVGMTDVNTKTRGNLDTGSFVAITENNQSSRAIMITNTDEGVLFYSESTGVMTAFSSCCSFSNAYNTYPLTLAPMTPNPTDGSYAAVLPLGNISVGGSGSITWYYAAGVITSLASVAETVAAAQVADAPPLPVASMWAIASLSSSAYTTYPPMASSLETLTPSSTSSASSSSTARSTSSASPSGTATALSTSSSTSSSTHTASPLPAKYYMTLQVNNDFMTSMIAINVVTIFVVVSCLSCMTVCGLLYYKRYGPFHIKTPVLMLRKARENAWTE